ncbi:hypothetical protein IC762_17695 [Bradyrhizobium genosp. L]|uniref:hypothetical protein n=1 Tax=Bradyrhizobium genosp. L TaxID=83637 RepID=UPI0018A26E3E|nr:hypothetical protein [Bradyrhizobium genosp. L]QPF81660.1 hypothetical protein IC762_17695 [Bradyrhizobium genosp. L]
MIGVSPRFEMSERDRGDNDLVETSLLIATGIDLDDWAEQLGVVHRSIVLDESETHVIDIRTGMPALTDDAFRRSILTRIGRL